MHSRNYLQEGDFVIRPGVEPAMKDCLFSEWTPRNRLAIVAPEPCDDLVRVAGIVLAWTYRFYELLAAKSGDFYAYPSHYLVAGREGAEPRMLGPNEEAEWSAAWCQIDVWPSMRHLVARPDSANLFAAALMVEPTHLLWPSRLPQPRDVELSFGPGDRKLRRLMRAHLEEVVLYGADPQEHPGAWQLSWNGGAGELTQQAARLLPGTHEPVQRTEWFVPVPIDSFLGLD